MDTKRQVNIRMTDQMIKDLDQAAKDQKRTRQQLAELVLEKYLNGELVPAE